MKAPLARNYSGREHCRWCCNMGQLPVEQRDPPYDEAYGPCPFCEIGARVEYGGAFGEEGYWKGRSTDGLVQLCTHFDKPGPPPEGARPPRIPSLLEALKGA